MLTCACQTVGTTADRAGGVPAARAFARPALRDRLLAMERADQALRKRWIRESHPGAQEKLAQAIRKLDEQNTAEMQGIIHELDRWPGRSLVGADGAMAAWLLIQHADQDIAFQKECLVLLQEAVRDREALPQRAAYLEDRILVQEDKKQIYGTQALMKDGGIVFYPIEDPGTVDQRRAKVGLPPLARYKKMVESMYKGHLAGD